MLRSERFSKWRHVAHGLKLERVLWAAKKAGITPWNAAHTHTQAHLITTVREHTWGVLAYSPPTNSSHLRNLTFKEGDSADVKQTEWTRTKHLNIKCSMIVFLPLHEISQGDLKKILQRETVTCFSHRCFLLLIDCHPHIIQNKAPSFLTDGLASNVVARFLLFWFYVTSVDTDKTAAQSMSAVFSTYSYITVYYTVALTKAKNFLI